MTVSAANLLLSSHRALITGGSRGIGLAVARHLAALGASTLLVSRDADRLTAASATLPRLHSDQHHKTHAGNVALPEFWQEMKGNKDVSILVNAAGITHRSLLATTKTPVIQDVLNTNLVGTILGCQAMCMNMLRKRSGVIVNIGSVLGLEKPGVGSAVYSASKAGVVGFSRALAAEVGRKGVRVNTVVPGYVDTEMVDAVKLRESGIPVSTAEEVAQVVGLLVTNQSMQGAEIVVDGGLRLGIEGKA